MTAAVPSGSHRIGLQLPIPLRFALRDLRGGLGGYWIFLLCIALGVAAITAVGSVSASLQAGLAREGRTILGGDVSFSSVSQPLSAAALDYLAARGRVSTTVSTRAMARRGDGESALVDVKAVDGAYPLSGAVGLDPPQPLGTALAGAGPTWGMAADPTIVSRLGLKLGDRVTIGAADLVLRAVLVAEPDKLAGGVAFAPRVLIGAEALRASGLVQPGSLARFSAHVDLGGGRIADEALDGVVAAAKAAFPEAGWEVKTRRAVSPEFDRNLGRFTQFLTLVGLTALVVGGVGIANAVEAAMQRKRPSLATLKAVGAAGRTVFALGLAQVMLVAVIGIGVGLAAGAGVPFLAAGLFGALIPFPLVPVVSPGVLALGTVFGLLTTLVFSLGPLGRVHDVPVSALFRDAVAPDATPLRLGYRLATLSAVLALAGTAIGWSSDRRLAFYYVLGTLAVFVLLRLVAAGVTRLARALPHPRWVALRIALANLHRPGALTPAVVLSLGLGLTLLVALSLIDDNVRRQVDAGRSGVTPSFFFLDVPSRQAEAFAAVVKSAAPGAVTEAVPMMRGRIVSLNGTPAEKVKPDEGSAWVLEGDRGITFADAVPKGSTLVAGAWWPPDHHGAPLVSFDEELARGLGLKLGDSVGVNVLGRTLTARIANLRKVDWQSMGINFVMVFSPDTFAGAPHMVLATAAFPDGGDGTRDAAVSKAVGAAFPSITTVRVKDVLDAVAGLLGKLAVAIRVASGITISASILVLAGALAAGRRARAYDSVVLKVLGATRGRLLVAYLLEYGLLGVATAMFGIAAGTLGAYAVVSRVMGFGFAFTWSPALMAVGAALVVTVGLGLVGTWRLLGESPSAYLRDP